MLLKTQSRPKAQDNRATASSRIAEGSQDDRIHPIPKPVLPTSSQEPGREQSLGLLSLPFEIRREIFSLVLSLESCSRRFCPSPQNPKRSQFAPLPTNTSFFQPLQLNLLLVSRQVHDETHLLPLQLNYFEFTLWFGSSAYACLKFLKLLQPFQIRAIRRMQLQLTQSDLGPLGSVDEICQKLVSADRILDELVGNGVRELAIEISGRGPSVCLFEGHSTSLFEHSELMGWVVNGLAKLTSRKKLTIKVAEEFLLPTTPGYVPVSQLKPQSGSGSQPKADAGADHIIDDFSLALAVRMPWVWQLHIHVQKHEPTSAHEGYEIEKGWRAMFGAE